MKRIFSAAVVVATMLGILAPVLHSDAATNTTVVLTFDDGVASQSIAKTALDAHGMHGTFYVNSAQIGVGGYLTWAQLTTFQAAGNEIGGHTLTHPDLTTLTTEQATAEVCNDRAAIASHGLTVTNFAYPYGNGYDNATVRAIVSGCGYNSARRAWGLYSSDPACGTTGCGYPYAASIPPADPLAIEAADNPETATTLAQIETLVTQAETHGGGLVPIVFHQICDACDTYSTTSANLTAFLDWLQPRSASGTVVKTMAQVIGGSVQPIDSTAPTSAIKCDGVACGGWFGPTTQVSLSSTDNANGSGVAAIRYTTDGSTPTTSSAVYTAPFTLPATKTVKFAAWDKAGNAETAKSQVVQIDAVAPTATIKCNGVACSATPYGSTAQVSLSGADTGGAGLASVRYTLDGSDPTSSSSLYSAAFAVSSTKTVKYRAFDNVGNAGITSSQVVAIDSEPPVSMIVCNAGPCFDGYYRAPVSVTLASTDGGGSGVASSHYTIDGSQPSLTSPAYSAPFTVPASTTVQYRAWDNGGNQEANHSQLIKIDTTAAGSAITCNGAACSNGWYRTSVQVALSAKDNRGGSGVDVIRYTTDGSTPTATSPAYQGPFTISGSRNVRYRVIDKAGNTGITKTTLVKIDTNAPVLSLKSPGVTEFAAGSVKISVSATDKQSRISRVHYYVDRRLVATDTRDPFSYTFQTAGLSKGTHRLKAKAYDIAGNSRTKSITITVS
jgi:peptidoglycan/xylan/chitin deacetylase (PgdA/CDA1 family)